MKSEEKLSSCGPVWHGSALGWHNDIQHLIRPIPPTYERFSAVILSCYPKNSILVISLYAPTSGKDDDFLECIGYLSECITTNMPESGSVIIGTDSNCSQKSSSRRKTIWDAFCEQFSLQIETSSTPTFHHHNGSSESCIDYFMSAKCIIKNLQQFCTLDSPTNLSSHDPILASIMVQKNKEQPSKYQHTYSSFDKKKVTWNKIDIPKYKRLTDEALRHAAVFWEDPEATPLLCVLFSELLVKCADLSSETSLEKSTNRMERKSQKKSQNLSKEETVLIKRFKEWKAAGKPRSRSNPIRISYVSARSNFQRARRYKDNLSFIFTNNELMRAEMSDRNIIYRKMKKLRGKTAHIKPSYLDTPVGVYHGEDILEGFAADAEHLGRERGESTI